MVSAYFENGKFAGNFSSVDFVPEGCLIASKLYPNNLIDGYWNTTLEEWYENASALEISQSLIEKETKKYLQRSKDGLDAYARISAEFRLAKQSGQLSEETHTFIEKTLIPVRNEVLAGQWISSLNELVSIGPELIGQELYNRLYNQISNYIDLNYSSLEQQQSLSLTSKK